MPDLETPKFPIYYVDDDGHEYPTGASVSFKPGIGGVLEASFHDGGRLFEDGRGQILGIDVD